MKSILQALFAAAATMAIVLPSAPAQCPSPDTLDCGTCCNQAQANLPKLPAFVQQSLDICWRDCFVDNTSNSIAEWTAPFQAVAVGGVPNCGVYSARLRLRDGSGNVKWNGAMRLHYSRTWTETAPDGTTLQVWRFLLNGDLRATSFAGTPPCPVPPCAAAHGGKVHYSGYVDYARSCTTNLFKFAWMLSHACDLVDHAPGFPRAGTFHPDRSYSFVGPAASFIPSPLLPTEGGSGMAEGVRRFDYPTSGTPGSIQCEFEEQIQHTLQPVQELCSCSSAGTTPQWFLGSLFIGGVCGTSVITTGAPHLPGFLSMGIGSWTDPNTFPGLEGVRWSAGGYDWLDACSGVAQPEVFFGVTTVRGFPANELVCTGIGAPLPPIFIDQANSLRAGATVMNVPYVSDHIININE